MSDSGVVLLGKAVIEGALRDLTSMHENGRPNFTLRRSAEYFLLTSKEGDFWADCAEISLDIIRSAAREIIRGRDEREKMIEKMKTPGRRALIKR